MKRFKTQFLMLLAVLMMTATGAKAEDVLYAVQSGTSITFSFGEAPDGAIVYNGNNTWCSSIRSEITSATFDASCAGYNGTKLNYLFYRFSNLETITGLDNLKTSEVTNMSSMFFMCSALTTLDLSKFNTANVTDMMDMFYQCFALTSLDLSKFNTDNVTNMNSMFGYCTGLTTLDLSSFNTAKVTNMGYMFYECKKLETVNLSSFNTAKVTDMSYMFFQCSALTSLDLSSFNTDNVTTMNDMFYECRALTSLDLSSFNNDNVTTMKDMFYQCSALTSLDLSSFNTDKVTNMNSMFGYCTGLTSLDLSSFNTDKVTNMGGMFIDCTKLSSIFVSDDWNTASVTSSDNMFNNCSMLVGEDGTSYNSSNITAAYAHFGTGGYLRNNYLYDNQDNTTRLTEWNGKSFGSVKIKGRTLKAGKWNSLCLPFYLSAEQIAASFPAGTEVKTLDSYTNDGSNVTVSFSDVSVISDNRPYIVFIPEGSDITDPVFRNVYIAKGDLNAFANTKGDATFIGTYAPAALSASTKHLFLQDNKLYYPNATTNINAFRAYFTLTTDVPTGGGAKIIVDFGDEDATAIDAVQLAESNDGNWHTLTGVKLDGKPSEKGIYIFNGKKIAVK